MTDALYAVLFSAIVAFAFVLGWYLRGLSNAVLRAERDALAERVVYYERLVNFERRVRRTLKETRHASD